MEKYFKMINTVPFNLRSRCCKVSYYTHHTIRGTHAADDIWWEVWYGVQYQVNQMNLFSVKDSTQRWIFGND